MQLLHRRRTLQSEDLSVADESAPRAFRDAVVVSVSAALTDRFADLGAVLGPGFDIRSGPPQAPGVALVAPQGTTAMAFYRRRHPKTALLVVGPGRRTGDQGPADYLNAGADGYLASAPTRVVAAHVRALARRQSTTSTPAAVRPIAVYH